jgi:NAD(P)-dependent dehydrogenase (short-subunit alcohol dehydrogenase family)
MPNREASVKPHACVKHRAERGKISRYPTTHHGKFAMLDLKGKIAFVAGAGSVGPGWGNGKATAVLLARQGAQIFATDIKEAAATETAGVIEKEGGVCVVHPCNMTNADEVRAAVNACVKRFGRIDILINNCGGSAAGDPVSMTEEVWDAQLDLNLKTAFMGCKFVLPVMEKQKAGVIINISSIAGFRHQVAGRVNVAYSTAKAGLAAFSRSTAMAYVKKGIRCNTVIVGTMHTPLVEERLVKQLGVGDAATLIAQRHAAVPIGFMGTGWDTANAVVFLASEEARYITGIELPVDGGISAGRV